MPEFGATIDSWIGIVIKIIEVGGVLVITGGIVWATYDWLKHPRQAPYQRYRQRLGRSLLLGLELLVAADIVRTVTLQLRLESLASLGLLVVIRTFLSWALEVEIEGRWPWQMHVEEERNDDKSGS